MKGKSKYDFENQQIQREKAKFKNYLQQNRFAKDTIRSYTNYVAYFLNFLEQQQLSPKDTTYNHIIEFINYCRNDSRSNQNINRLLMSVRHYYDYLGQTENINNPAAGIYIQGATKRGIGNLPEYEEIEEVYNSYRVYDERTYRNKIILGLMLYQAVTTEELHKLGPQHINLEEGKIFIPGGSKTNSRMLKLQPQQILKLHEYIKEIRPKILQQSNSSFAETKQLFISMNGLKNIKSSLLHLMWALKKINPGIKSGMQIRKTVIAQWLKTKDVREVQYMAGHKHVGSTEKYKQYDLKGLREQLKKYHPLN